MNTATNPSRLPAFMKSGPFKFGPLWLAHPAIAFLCIFFLVPVFRLLALSVQDTSGTLTTAHYARLIDTEVYWRILSITFRIAALTALFSLLLGYPLAYWLSGLKESRRNQMLLLVLVPFWTSYLVKTFSWMLLLGNDGILNRLLSGAGIIDTPLPLMYNEFGVIVGMVHAMMPLAVLTMMPVMAGIDRRLGQAAGTLVPATHIGSGWSISLCQFRAWRLVDCSPSSPRSASLSYRHFSADVSKQCWLS